MAGREVINMKAFFFRAKALITRMISQFSPPPRKFASATATASANSNPPRVRLQNLSLFSSTEEVSSHTLLFHLEEAVLRRPCSLFPYFMLVAFEAGGLLRALVLFLTYPLVRLAGQELGLKIMVFVSFFGIRRRDFRAGRAVLPKFLLEDAAAEGLDLVTRPFERRVGLTNLPRLMVEGFMADYLGVEAVFGRELKEVCGYFVGLMEEKRESDQMALINHMLGEEKADSRLIGLCGLRRSLDHHHHQQLLSNCKVVYIVSENEKKNWQGVPREKYPKPLIFHDGRLAFKPDFLATLEMLTWLPFGLVLFATRLAVALSLPHKISIPILSFAGMHGTVHKPRQSPLAAPNCKAKSRGTLYVCNHRTLLDPIYLSMALDKPLMAVTYSLSKVSELLSPIRTVRLTRDRERDSGTMERLLRQSDLVVCPEGTTCREPYLLRFSPLFAELTDEIVPVAMHYGVGMFYGTTAGGLKFMDPVFLLLNPLTNCSVKVLERLPQELTCGIGGKSKFEVANYVQSRIGEALGFECTNLTRKDKYIVLAGNEGRV